MCTDIIHYDSQHLLLLLKKRKSYKLYQLVVLLVSLIRSAVGKAGGVYITSSAVLLWVQLQTGELMTCICVLVH